MSTDNQILSPHWSGYSSLHKIIAIIIALLVLLLWLLGYGPGGSKCAVGAAADCGDRAAIVGDASSSSNASSATSDAVSGTADAVKTGAAIVAATGAAAVNAVRDASFLDYDVPEYSLADGFEAARIYFDVDSYSLTEDDDMILATVYQYLKNDPTAVAVVSGFHDPSGDLLHNQELAKNRAVAVRDAMIAKGFPDERIILEKPFQVEGSGSDAEARRVEINIAHLR